MANEGEGGAIPVEVPSSHSAAAGIAVNAARREMADEYMKEQPTLARLQIQNLMEQNSFELSHLRFRRFWDYAEAG